MKITSIYQTEEWKKVMKLAGYIPVEIDGINAFENNIVSPFGKRKIIFARGSSDESALEKFREKAKGYWYGTITPKITCYENKLFERLGFKRIDDFTIMIDLSKSEEELWNELEKKSIKWGVKTAEKNNLMFKEAEMGDIKELYLLYGNTAKKGGFKAETIEFFKKIRELLVKKNQAKIFVVKKERQVLAGGVMLIDSDHTMVHLTGASDEGYKLQAMPLLYWKIILYSKTLGKKFIDLGGFDKEAREGDKTYNINKFKERFGGKIVAQPVYSTNWRYTFIRKQMKRLRLLKSIYSKEKKLK